MEIETRALVRRWIIAFREPPVLIDAELMLRVLADVEGKSGATVADDSTETRA
jgi:hypothetical protein